MPHKDNAALYNNADYGKSYKITTFILISDTF